MASNFPGEWEIRINYDVAITPFTDSHQQRFSFDANTVGLVGEAFDQWFPIQRGGGEAASLQTLVDAYGALLQDVYNPNLSILDVELWKYAALSFDATWYSAYDLNLSGTGTLSSLLNSEQIMVFRTTQGGTMRAHFMQGPVAAGNKQTPPTNPEYDAIWDAILAISGWFKGRDGGFAVAGMGFYPGENESLFKAHHRA